MTNKEVLEARCHYCFGRSCDNCLFHTYARDKFNTRCGHLTTYQIHDILSIIKEEESMTKKEEIQQEIEKTQKQLAALQEKLKEAEDEVPETLDINDGDKFWAVDGSGNICWTWYAHTSPIDAGRVHKHRTFLSEEYAKIFADSTQLIADQLHFKYLYDRDYKPNWRTGESKHIVIFDYVSGLFCENFEVSCGASAVQFSTEELAKKCADWLNKKYGYTKE